MRKQLGIFLAIAAFAWAPPAAAFDDDDYYLSCVSRIGGAYTGTGRGLTYYSYLKIADLRQLPEPEEKLQSIALSRFAEWAKATGQYGRWNSVWDSDFDCNPAPVDVKERALPAMAASTDRDYREIRLPADWYKRKPSAASAAELARYSTGATAPGSYLPNSASLIVAPSAPPVQSGWDEQVREQLRKDAEGRSKAVAATAREDARMKAQADKFFAEMKKRGSAQ
jgi:hypothetical protein